jgi:hypothetical protein
MTTSAPRHRAESKISLVTTVLPAAACALAVLALVLWWPLAGDAARTAPGGAGITASEPPLPPETTAPPTDPNPPPAVPPRPKSSAELPAGAPFPARGTGGWRVVPGGTGQVGQGQVQTYTVEIENGVVPPGGDAAFATTVDATLADPRSWIGRGDVALRRIGTGTPDLRIRLASQATARDVCGFEIPVDVSCRSGSRVFLSAARWIRGAVAFGDDLARYRQYMVNHEVGHFLGNGHKPCKAHGAAAPVMMQQTFSTSNDEILDITAQSPQGVTIPRDGKVCRPNPWPFGT